MGCRNDVYVCAREIAGKIGDEKGILKMIADMKDKNSSHAKKSRTLQNLYIIKHLCSDITRKIPRGLVSCTPMVLSPKLQFVGPLVSPFALINRSMGKMYTIEPRSFRFHSTEQTLDSRRG
jgi:hypothetical protein